MKKIFAIIFAFLTLFTASFSTACQPKSYSVDFYYFNTYISLITKNKSISKSTKDKIDSLFSSLEKEFSLSENHSFVSEFNSYAKNTPIKLSTSATEVIKLTKECYDFTDKKFNPTVFPFVKLWSFYPDYPILNFAPPTDSQINALKVSGITDYDAVVLDEKNGTVTKTLDSIEIDLGGFVKGYALDKVSKILLEDGYDSGYINIGSSSLFIMQSDSLKIKHPRATKENPVILSVHLTNDKNSFVSTSGDYEKTYTFNGKTYSHVINPETGYPMDTGIISATVIGENGGVLDALSTALCLCSFDDGENDSELILMMNKITNKYPSSKIFVVYKGDKNLVITNQKEGENFALLDSEYEIVNI